MRELDREAWASVKGGKNSMAVHCRNNGGGSQYFDVGIVDMLEPKAQ